MSERVVRIASLASGRTNCETKEEKKQEKEERKGQTSARKYPSEESIQLTESTYVEHGRRRIADPREPRRHCPSYHRPS